MFHCRRPGGGRVGGWLRDERDRGFAGAAPPDSSTFRIERPSISSSSSVFDRGPYGLSWLDLAGRWLRLDRLAATAVARLLSPAGCAGIPRGPNKSAPRRPPRRSGSKPSAASIAPGPSIAIEAAMVAGSKQRSEENYHGEHRLFQEGQCRVRSRRAKCPLCQVIVIDVGQS